MEEINAWGAYEIAATQNARSLGEYARRSSHGKKRTTNPSENNNAAPRIQSSQLDQNIKNLRHDSQPDNSSLRRTDDAPSPSKNLFGNEAGELKASTTGTSSRIIDDPEIQEEWSNIRDLARDLFQVYFTTDDSYADVEKMNHIKCKFHSLFLGTMPWLTQYIQKLDLPRPVVETLLFIEASFRGIGQVYFQNNPLSGLVILVAMFVQSSRVAIHGVIALFAGNLAGIFMGFDKCLVSCGLFGYNSFLVGLAMATFHRTADNNGFSWQIIVGSVIFAYFSSILFILLGKLLGPYKTPPFTFPFNFATLTFLLATSNELHKGDNSVINNGGSISAQDFLAGSVRGLGQVFLANNIISGVLVLVAIGICSRISALSAFLGSVIGAGVAVLAGNSVEAIENGMFGFNPSLTFTAMLMFYVPSLGSFSVGIMASVVTVFVQGACETVMRPYGLPFMTLPFCFSALSYIAIQGTTSNVISVPLSSMTTPEDHLKRVRRLSDGFQLLCGALHSSYGPSKNTLILGSVSGKIDKKVEVILEKYDEEIIGGKRKNFCRMLLQGLLFRKPRTKNHTKSSSFRLSFALRNPAFEDNEKDSYASIFHHIDSPTNYTIIKRQFKEFLNTVGFVDEAGLDFACKSFELIDLDGSGDIDLEEFIVFAKISRHMAVIRRLIVKFFNFVDIRGDRSVSIIDLESARSYLGLSSLSHDDIVSLKDFCDDDDKLEFSKIVNFVTIFKLESIIKSYKSKREGGESLDKSIHSALTEI